MRDSVQDLFYGFTIYFSARGFIIWRIAITATFFLHTFSSFVGGASR